MKIKTGRSSTKLKIAAFLFAAALTVVGILQYRWLSDSAAREIDRAYRSIFSTVSRTTGREYERYSVLIQALGSLEIHSEDALKKSLLGLIELYGSQGTTPYLLATAGYISPGEPKSFLVYSTVSGEWIIPEVMLKPEDDIQHMETLQPGRMDIFPEAGGKTAVFYRLISSPEWTVILFLDTEGFLSNYLQPALSGALPEYSIEWLDADMLREKRGEYPGMFFIEEYRFELFRALFGKSYLARHRPIIPVTPFFSLHRTLRDDSAEGNRPPGPIEVRRIGEEDGMFLQVGLPKGQFAGNIERNLALTWLGSIILLAGIGTAFLLLLYQVHRVREVRDKEREFVASVTHELRTPLTVIQSAADNLTNGVVPAKRLTQYGPLIQNQIKRLSAMIEEMLIFSGMEGNAETVANPVPIQFRQFFTNLDETLKEPAREKSIRLRWDIGGLPSGCMGNPDDLRLILENLVLNAVNHAYPKDPGIIRIYGRLRLPDTLVFVVEDEGRGISQAEQGDVFEPFYRDSISRETQEKGSGLGLYISRRKARLAGGNLTLESPYDRIDSMKQTGCRFILELPYVPIKEEAHDAEGPDY